MSSIENYQNLNRFQLADIVIKKFNLIEGYKQKSKEFYLSLLNGTKKVPKLSKLQIAKVLAKRSGMKTEQFLKSSYEELNNALNNNIDNLQDLAAKTDKTKWELIKLLEKKYKWEAKKSKKEYTVNELYDILEAYKNKNVQTSTDKVAILINLSLYKLRPGFKFYSPVRGDAKLKEFCDYAKIDYKEAKIMKDLKFNQIRTARKLNKDVPILQKEKNCVPYVLNENYDYQIYLREELKANSKNILRLSEYIKTIRIYTSIKIIINKKANYENDIHKAIFKRIESFNEKWGYELGVLTGSVKVSIMDFNTKTKLKEIKMKRTEYEYKSLGEQKMIITEDNGTCVLQALYYTLVGEEKFKKLTMEKLITQFQNIDKDILTNGISTSDLYEWAKKYNNYISIYAISPLNELFFKYEAPVKRLSFVYKLNGEHCYLITDSEHKNKIIRSVSHQLDSLNFEPIIRDDNYKVLNVAGMKSMEIVDIISNQNQDKEIIIISGTTNLNKIAVLITLEHKYYIEYLNFCESSLVGFINPVNDIKIILNNDVEACFKICDELYAISGNPLHKFRNQSLSALSKIWFSEIYGNLQTSVYNDTVLNSIDKYPVKALVMESNKSDITVVPDFDNWEKEQEFLNQIPTEYKYAIDICKSNIW